MVRLPKIAIGTQKRKSHFDLTHDVTTTSDFGFCQPTVVRHLNAKSKSILQTSVGVRLSALPTPTFGRIRLKTYNCFVPIQEVFEAFDYMQARKSVASVFGDYVPQSADKITIQQLLNVIYAYSWSQWSILYDENGNIVPSSTANPFLNFNILCPSLKSSNITWNDERPHFNDYTLISPSTLFTNEYDEHHISDDNIFAEFRQAIALRNGGGSSASQYVDIEKLHNLYIPNMNVDSVTNELFDMFYGDTTNINAFLGQKEYLLNPVKRSYIATRGSESSYDMWQKSFDVSITKTIDGEEKTLLVPCLVTCNWTKYGQRLLKVLTACGVRGFEYLDDVVDLNKLFAYYKAWFDIMNPGRTRQWRETPCYKLIHTYYDDPTDIYTLMSRDSSGHDGTVAIETFVNFLIDLTNCCYVLPIDNFTAATPQPILQLNTISSTNLQVDTNSQKGILIGTHGNVSNSNDNYPHVSNDVGLNGLLIDGLLKLYKLANKNSVIGSRIEDYLRTKFGYSIERSNVLQSSEMVVKIEEMFATNTNEFNYLGELGGRGSKDNAGTNKITFEAPTFGIFVQFMCVVPFGDYVQGNIKPKLTVNDWYQEVYDSLGKEALSMSEILARSSDMSIGRVDSSFGFVPMYWRDKVQNSMHNGAFSLPSQRDVLLPYSLDRLFNEHYKKKVIDNGEIDWVDVPASVITPSEELRYIGRTPDFGSYDRIFFDNTGYMDNFILHIIEQWDYYADMKPISQSFETFDDENDDSITNVTAS